MSTTKAYKGLPMEGLIASWYARTTRKDMKRHAQMARELIHRLPAGADVLEIAPGPGYFCVELAGLGSFHITGLDISRSFVQMARENARKAGLDINFQEGNASAMPFADASFDFAFCQAAFKNFSDPVGAISEVHRVLRPGGTALIVDMRRDASRQDIEREVRGMRLGWINEVLVGWTFRTMLLKSAYSTREMQAMIARTPFKTGRIEEEGIGFRAWLSK
jgi:ubiquinone/menaquinone biosynthesis C-methylase UbiE